MNLKILGRALRVRWLWLSRTSEPQPTLPARVDPITQSFFNASIKCEIGDGNSTLFWSDPWLEGSCLSALVPDLVDTASIRCRNRRLVATALSEPDRVIWKWCPSGLYSCSSAYQAFFVGQSALLGAKELWKVKAPNEFRLFFWLAIQGRCWTS
ncbi:hypothetical protein BAE44_0010616 [Dichanthelium oligosanthes]|uniref:Reverse transcriptase zinc-binding domain-containing protein n=1 Tax=Dichanthelium oligosanthes TaxID=888268 RepID=A0A1E5VTB7_9POAL|nr:hypothetical protein BAE44_0010616 [Dichanthelium oligosanthes]